MVNYKSPVLDRTFAALGDPTRRVLMSKLVGRSLTVSELARPFPVSLQAIMKHLNVLVDAGLVTRKKTGRTVTCTLNAEPMAQAARWLVEQHQRAWSDRLDQLDIYLRRIQQGEHDEQA